MDNLIGMNQSGCEELQELEDYIVASVGAKKFTRYRELWDEREANHFWISETLDKILGQVPDTLTFTV